MNETSPELRVKELVDSISYGYKKENAYMFLDKLNTHIENNNFLRASDVFKYVFWYSAYNQLTKEDKDLIEKYGWFNLKEICIYLTRSGTYIISYPMPKEINFKNKHASVVE